VENRNRERKSFTFFIIGFVSTRTKTKKKRKRKGKKTSDGKHFQAIMKVPAAAFKSALHEIKREREREMHVLWLGARNEEREPN
jgi:uncharacterized membrane protein